MFQSGRRGSFIFGMLGLLLIASGIICNEWILAWAFSPDGVLEASTKVTIWAFDFCLLLSGSFLVRYRRSIEPKQALSHLVRSYPKILAATLGVISTLTALLSIEGVCYFLNRRNRSSVVTLQEGEYFKKGFYQLDRLLAFKPKPNVRMTARLIVDGNVVYDSIYSTDQYSRRVTPADGRSRRDNFLLFFGCSFTFGVAVNDNETMPYYAGHYAPAYMPYNYGVGGYGPQQMLRKLKNGGVRDEVREKRGVLIYTFIDGHVERAIGSMYVLSKWTWDLPYYYIDGDGVLRDGSNFQSGKPLTYFLYRRIGRTELIRYFNLHLPKIDNEQFLLTARIVEESFKAYNEKFGGEHFYVLIYPASRFGKRMIPHLKKAGIKFLDYSHLMTRKEFATRGEGHPTAQAHEIVAKKLVNDLTLLRHPPEH